MVAGGVVLAEKNTGDEISGATGQINCSISEARYSWSNGPER